jgi:hypothetical protein
MSARSSECLVGRPARAQFGDQDAETFAGRPLLPYDGSFQTPSDQCGAGRPPECDDHRGDRERPELSKCGARRQDQQKLSGAGPGPPG